METNKYIFKYNNFYYKNLIDERVKLFMNRDLVLNSKIPNRLLSKDYTLKDMYTDFVRLSFILGEPFIGKLGYKNIFY